MDTNKEIQNYSNKIIKNINFYMSFYSIDRINEMNESIDKLMLLTNNNIEFKINDNYKLIDLILLTKLYNFSQLPMNSYESISNYLNNNEYINYKNIIKIIENDDSLNNPLLIICKYGTNIKLLISLLERLKLSQDNIENKPGLKFVLENYSSAIINNTLNLDFLSEISSVLERNNNSDNNFFLNLAKEIRVSAILSNLFNHKISEKNIYLERPYFDKQVSRSSQNINSAIFNLVNDTHVKQNIEKIKANLTKYSSIDFSSLNEIFLNETYNNISYYYSNISKKDIVNSLNVTLPEDQLKSFNIEEFLNSMNKSDNIFNSLINYFTYTTLDNRYDFYEIKNKISIFETNIENLINSYSDNVNYPLNKKINSYINSITNFLETIPLYKEIEKKQLNQNEQYEFDFLQKSFLRNDHPLIKIFSEKLDFALCSNLLKNTSALHLLRSVSLFLEINKDDIKSLDKLLNSINDNFDDLFIGKSKLLIKSDKISIVNVPLLNSKLSNNEQELVSYIEKINEKLNSMKDKLTNKSKMKNNIK